ncbi:MAG TPA: class I SAM-dependent methyltransferase [Ktedonobacteraceae bacterium]|nr:class I SAM-dependent methyltransferase [Ktedonobacteraceae bacterium]
MVSRPSPSVDLSAIKARQQKSWSAGDYAVIGATLVVISEELCEAIDLHAGQVVLDVATGSGNTAIAAARRFCNVTGTDYVPALLEVGRRRAAAEHLPVTFQEGDAEQLPFADASFDVVSSTLGVMFTPNQEQAASELIRVCRSGGKIGLANWTPTSFIGDLFRSIGKYVPPAPGVKPGALWGTEQRLRELFGDAISSLATTTRTFLFRYRSAGHWIEVFSSYYGPIVTALQSLDAARQQGLTQEVADLLERYNRAKDGTLVVPSDYLEAVAVKR